MNEYELQLALPVIPQVALDYFAVRKEIDRFNINGVDATRWLVNLTTRANMLTWGENLTIQIYSDANGFTNLVIRSFPAVATTLVDWGRNKENVERLAQAISNDFYAPQEPL